MAGYRKQYPKFINSRDNHVKTLEEWREQSFIGYIKEPEVKVGEIGYCIRITEHTPDWMRKPGKIEEVRKDSILVHFDDTSGFVLKEDYSH